MFVRELMSAPATTVASSTPVKDAARLLRDRDIAAVPVVDDDRLVGIVSEIDLLRGSLLPDPVAHLLPVPTPPDAPATVAEVMTADVQVLAPQTDLYDAARLMAATGVRSAPVVEGDRVLGVLSRSDLLRALARTDADIEQEVRRSLAEEVDGDLPCAVDVLGGVVTLTADPPGTDLTTATLLAGRVGGVVGVRTG